MLNTAFLISRLEMKFQRIISKTTPRNQLINNVL